MLNACNFRCTYCDNHQGEHYFDRPDPERLDTQQGKRLLERMITGTPAIYWCGGEPTLRNDLPELLDHAWHLGFFPNMINTNGSLLHQRLLKPAWQGFLWQMDVVIISLDGLTLSMLNKLWGVKRPEQVMVNLLLMRELRKLVKFKLVVNTVITPETIDEARAVFDLVCDLDIWFVPVPVNYRHEPNRELLNHPRYRQLADLILARKKEGHKIIGSAELLRRLLFCEPYHCVTALKPHVWSNGEICWPCRASSNVAPVNINLLDYNSFDDAYEAGGRHINPNFFGINGKSYPATKRIGIKQGEWIRIRLINASGKPHHMHLHGHDFWWVSQDGNDLAEPRHINTVHVEPGGTYDIMVYGDNPGYWTFHDHATTRVTNNGIYPGGMLTVLEYEDFTPTYTPSVSVDQ